MPDDRFFHKRAGHSDKVNQLTDFEELIWRYYVLSADDFGVMKFTAAQIRTDHERAEKRPERVVQRAMERILDVGLVNTFEHQGRTYCYSRNWQRYQKVDYPRETMLPKPPDAELAECEESTCYLFAAHPGGKENLNIRRTLYEQFPNPSAVVLGKIRGSFLLTRAGALAQAEAQADRSGSGDSRADAFDRPEPKTNPQRAGAFCEWYSGTHERLIGVGYIGNPRKDYEMALQLVAKFSDQELRDAATVWFGQRDSFAVTGTRTVTKFASRASALVMQAREVPTP